MGNISVSVTASMVLIAMYYLLLLGTLTAAETTSLNSQKSANPSEGAHFRSRGGILAIPRLLTAHHRPKPAQEIGWFLDEDEDSSFGEVNKRFDDYGHMRFGKRGAGEGDQFDDYGHMRFGRRRRSLSH